MTASTHTPRRTPCACGSDEFVISETTCHLARLEDGRLDVFENDCSGDLTDTIACAHCSVVYDADEFEIGDLYA